MSETTTTPPIPDVSGRSILLDRVTKRYPGQQRNAVDALDLDTELSDAVVVAEWGGGLVEQISASYLLITLDRTTAALEDPESEARLVSWELH